MNTNEHELEQLIRQGESLTLEFKSDRKPLPDRELVTALEALANTGDIRFEGKGKGGRYVLSA
jgi:ATP-dependent DNA helicase RecG